MRYNKEIKPLSYNEAKEKALKLLEFRSHSEKELSDKLKRSGADCEIIDEVMNFLREYKLVNDADYAARYAHDLQNLKKLGKNRIKTELLTKGISYEIIEEVISCLPKQEENVLCELVKKRLKNDFDKKNIDKTMRYFIYRGYSPDEIKQTIESLRTEENGL